MDRPSFSPVHYAHFRERDDRRKWGADKNEEYCIFIILSSHNILLPLYLGPILTLHSLLTLFAPIDCKDGFVENIIMKNCRFKL